MNITLVSSGVALACLVLLPELLYSSRIFDRLPHAGLAVWGSLCAIGWTSMVVFLLKVSIDSSSTPLLLATLTFLRHLGDGHPLRGLGLVEVVGLSLAMDIVVLFVGTFIVVGWKTVHQRNDQRAVLDLVSASTMSYRVQVLDHAQPLAYYMPGDGGRVVLSTGTFDLLDENELGAVIAHEQGHRRGHHGIFLVPLQTLSNFVQFLPLSRRAPGVMRGYLEMMADDYATSRSSKVAVQSALAKAPTFRRPPIGAFGAVDHQIDRRLLRLNFELPRFLDAAVVLVVICAALSISVSLAVLPS
jgi:Peptidase family M48